MKINAPILIIYNANAGQRRKDMFFEILHELDNKLVKYDVIKTEFAGHGEVIARDMSQINEVKTIVAAGGDGTINEVLNGMRASAKPLGIIPLGTANVLAKELGIKINAMDIAEVLMRAHISSLYVATINDQIFSLMASVGYDAGAVKNVNIKLKKKVGEAAYVFSFIRELIMAPKIAYNIEVDGNIHYAYGAIITNGKFYGGKYICAPDASIKENKLHAILFKKSGAIQAIKYFWAIVNNTLYKSAEIEVFEVDSVEISSNHEAPVQIDGDYFGELPVKIGLIERPVSIICPKT